MKAITRLLFLDENNEKFFGEGPYRLLKEVEKSGSLRSAAASMGMACADKQVEFFLPPPILCTDNAAMIGAAAYYEYMKGVRHGLDLNAVPNLKLGEKV